MMRIPLLCMLIAAIPALLAAQEQPVNVALGASYTMTQPNYSLSAHPDDVTHLTDGVYTTGYFWTQPTTVGWSRDRLVYITLDLGEVHPISGLSFNTAAGVAHVHWPRHIIIFVSADGEQWHSVGDLMELVGRETLPEYGTYAVHRLVTHDLEAHGRYVQLAMLPQGQYIFVDEIEVYGGPEELLDAPLPGEPVADVSEHLQVEFFNLLIREQLRRDLAAVRESIGGPGLTDEQRETFAARADELARHVTALPNETPEGFRAVLPMNELERDIFRLHAEVWRAQGKPALRIWHKHRWDYLGPSEEPAADAPAPVLSARMMNGEVRADVLNFTNAADEDVTLRLRITGLPGGEPPPYIAVREVLHVGTARFVSVAAALPEAAREGDAWLITVPSGMTGQAWFELRPTDLAAGRHSGVVTVTGPEGAQSQAPIDLFISPLRFPGETSLLVGGWDYTDAQRMYGVTSENRDALIAYLKDMRVNMPWATSASTPEGRYDDDHQLIEPPDTTRFDNWVADWDGARLHMVFLAKTETFAGTRMGTEEFNARLGNWARFWAQHMRDLGLEPSQLGFLVYDEPHDERGYDISEQWARAINAAEPDLVMFVDPQPRDPETPLAMYEQMDVICPHRPQWLQVDWFHEAFAAQRELGKELWFYSAHGPARAFDPFSYYLMQAWHVFSVGGKGSCFWAFADTGRVSVWNEYATVGRGPYCPLYLDDTSVTTAKWMEAVRESAFDVEYLTMLQERVAELEAAGRGDAEAVRRARALLVEGPQRVMAQERGLNYTWDEDKDRALADRVRGEVLDLLEEFAG